MSNQSFNNLNLTGNINAIGNIDTDALIAENATINDTITSITSNTNQLNASSIQCDNNVNIDGVLTVGSFNVTALTSSPDNTDYSNKVSTTKFTVDKINEIIGTAPLTLDTLKEIADAMNNDPDFYTTITAMISADRVRLSQNEADIININNSITTNSNNITTNTNNIATNLASINTINTNISNNDTEIAANLASINTNTTSINTNSNSITTNSNNITTNSNNITTNTNDIANNLASINTHTTSINTNTNDIATNLASINTHTTSINTNTTDIATNLQSINTHTTSIATNTSAINTNQAAIVANTNNITSLTTSLTNNNAELTTIDTELTSINNDIGVIQSDILTIKTDINTLENADVNKEFDLIKLYDVNNSFFSTIVFDETNNLIKFRDNNYITQMYFDMLANSIYTDNIILDTMNVKTNITNLNNNTSNIDNTSDLNKPISTAQQSALDLKANQSSITNIDNTSDENKPVSTAQQTALNNKIDINAGQCNQLYVRNSGVGNIPDFNDNLNHFGCISSNFSDASFDFWNDSTINSSNTKAFTFHRITDNLAKTEEELVSIKHSGDITTVGNVSSQNISTMTTNIATNSTDIATNANAITTNATNIANNATQNVDNMLFALQNNPLMYMIDGLYTTTFATYLPFHCSMKYTPAFDDGFLLMPYVKIVAYTNTNYTGTQYAYDNTSTAEKKVFASQSANSCQSFQLFFNGTQINIAGIS